VVGVVVAAVALVTAHARPSADVHRLGRHDLERYCSELQQGQELMGGAAGPHSWRCRDLTRTNRAIVSGLSKLVTVCVTRFGPAWRLELADPTDRLGWSCYDSSRRAASEPTTPIAVDPNRPVDGFDFGDDPNNTAHVAVYDSFDTVGSLDGDVGNLFVPTTVSAYCTVDGTGEHAPPFVVGVVLDNGSRGFVRSEWTTAPIVRSDLPTCT